MSNRTEVATKVAQLAEALDVDISDVTIEVEEDGFSSTVIDGTEVAEFISDGDEHDEADDTTTSSGVEEEPDEDTTSGGDEVEVHLSEMDYNDVQKLASEKLNSFPDDSSKAGLIEALEGNIGDVEHTTSGGDDQTSEKSDDENDSISDAELVEMGVKESNISDVRKYRERNGVCDTENCPYGANDDSDHCASHQSKTDGDDSNNSNSGSSKSYDNLTEGQKAAAQDLLTSGEVEDLEEAVQMV